MFVLTLCSLRSNLFRFLLAGESESQGEVAGTHEARAKRGTGGGGGEERKCLQLSPHILPFFARAKHRKSRLSDFLCSLTPRKRLLRRLTIQCKYLRFLVFATVFYQASVNVISFQFI